MIMTLSLLVYSIAERIMRKYLETMDQTLPNQIKKETVHPTLRWIFQVLEGIDFVTMKLPNGESVTQIHGLLPIHLRILACFPPAVQNIYEIAA